MCLYESFLVLLLEASTTLTTLLMFFKKTFSVSKYFLGAYYFLDTRLGAFIYTALTWTEILRFSSRLIFFGTTAMFKTMFSPFWTLEVSLMQ